MRLTERYRPSLALLTDLYQLTMAYGYWKNSMVDTHACFHLFFRHPPFDGGYAVAAGLPDALDYLSSLHFDEDDLAYLKTLQNPDGSRLFEEGFIEYLRNLKLEVDVQAVPEGTVMFGNEPLIRVSGPILQCQLLETPLLALVNFSTLIATKASRVAQAARWAPVLEFGLRRAQGPDGGVTAARAAYVGGCSATSNVMTGRLYGIPVKGTHAHSWVMAFNDDVTAFDAWTRAMPKNSILLVDTYDSIEGVHHAVQAGRRLREQGHELAGIRLDSGDLAELSIKARAILDEAGFPNTKIVGSGDLDEYRIAELEHAGAKIDIWGVGTRLTTAYEEPALGGVYKLAAVRAPGQDWDPRVKVSDSPEKTTVPGLLQVRRFYDRSGQMMADCLYDVRMPPEGETTLVDPTEPSESRVVPGDTEAEDLLVPVMQRGRVVYTPPPIEQARQRTLAQIQALPEGVRRLQSADTYPVGLDVRLHRQRARRIEAHRSE